MPGAFRSLLSLALAFLGCTARGATPAVSPSSDRSTGADATEAYLGRLLVGDHAALLGGFSGEPAVDDPLRGQVRGAASFQRFVVEQHDWLRGRAARIVPGRITRGGHRTVVEAVLDLGLADRRIELPVAVVGEAAEPGRVRVIRVYHSLWPLEGRHRVRPPLLPRDDGPHGGGVVGEYQRALAAGDVDAIVVTFEADGYFREPSGGIYVHRGRDELRKFMAQILGAGGIGIDHATVTDDGVATAIEFNAVRFGRRAITPQAGLAVYERGASGRLAAARIYDDVNVEVLGRQQ